MVTDHNTPPTLPADSVEAHAAPPLGSRFVVRALLISRPDKDGSLAASSQAVKSVLTKNSHSVTIATPQEWRLLAHDPAPEVILLDIAHIKQGTAEAPDYETLADLCQQIRRLDNLVEVPLVALVDLPVAGASTKKQPTADSVSWSRLSGAGLDDVLNTRASETEIEAHICVLSHYGRVRQELQQAREQLNRHTQYDEVTQLMNRRFFFQAAHRETSRARRYRHTLSSLMVDVDYFDRITKNYGYACGDYVLRAVSYIVRQWTRESDIVGRFSETKIAALLPETTVQGASVVRDKIQRAVAGGQFEWNGEKLPVSVSIGEAERRWDMPEPDDATSEASPQTQDIEASNVEASEDDLLEDVEESETLSVREELADLLADADAALNIAKKSALCPPVFVEYAVDPSTSPSPNS